MLRLAWHASLRTVWSTSYAIGRQVPEDDARSHALLPGTCEMLWLCTSDVLPAAIENRGGGDSLLSIVHLTIAVRIRQQQHV